MKNKISAAFVIALTILTSCERYIELTGTGPEKLLVVNGYVRSDESEHSVLVAWSTFKEVKPVNAAHLECYVNGTKVSETSELHKAENSIPAIKRMTFNADFNAGDEVRVVVESEGTRVESVSVAPKAPVIVKADTTTVKAKDNFGDLENFAMFSVTVQDVKGEDNYYRALMDLDSKYFINWVSEEETEHKVGDCVDKGSKSLVIDNSQEPLLRRRIGKEKKDDDDWNFYNNRYNIFTDSQFRNSEYTMKLIVDHYRYLHNFCNFGYNPENVKVEEDREVVVKIMSMSKLTYLYMNDYMFDHSSQGDWSLVSELPYPSNVKGGTGLVSVMTAATFNVRLPKWQLPNNIWTNY